MGLVKNNSTPVSHEDDVNKENLLQQLCSEDVQVRRAAALELAAFEETIEVLLSRLRDERALPVREGILTALMKMKHPKRADGLLEFLRSEDVELRCLVIECLRQMPDEMLDLVDVLFADADVDVRIFAADICRKINHPKLLSKLLKVIEGESDTNVIVSILEALGEVGDSSALPALKNLNGNEDPYLSFAIQTAIARIETGRS